MRHLVAALILSVLIIATGSAQDLLLKNGQIVDPASRKISNGAIIIRGGMIAEVLPEAPATFDGTVVDLKGKWIIPGLNDMHVHSFGNVGPGNEMQLLGTADVARLMLYSGVTGFLDLFMAEDQIIGLRDKQRSSGLPGADIYCAGPIITCPGGHGTEYGIPTRTVNTPAEAEREITALALKRPDVVKIVYDHAFTRMPSIDRPTMEAAIKTASKHGLKTVIHIGTWQDAREAIEAGASCITHIYLDEEIPDDLVTLMRERGVYEIPTLTVENDFANFMRDKSLLQSPLLAAVASPTLIAAYGDTTRLDARLKYWYGMQINGEKNLYRSVKKLIDGGVTVLAGTDAGNPGTFQGYSLHRELRLLVKAGMTPWDALGSATTRAGEFLGRNFGIAPGAVANLVVLEASPIADIANTEKIAMVIHHGDVVNREEMLRPKSVAWTRPGLDDFSSQNLVSTIGELWRVDIDTAWGGTSTIRTEKQGGMLRVSGKMQSGKGMPGLAGVSLLFDTLSTLFDVSEFDGIKVRVKAVKGTLLLKLLTAGVKNYDFHQVAIANTGDFQTLELPFAKFRQLWSAQIPWTGKDVRGVAFWVSGFMAEEFDFTIDSIELYRGKR